jgi:CubicO group peptidase (beta-lactamase class C family)
MKYFLPVCLLFIYTASFAQKNVNPTFEKNITLDAFEIEIQREISDRIIAGAVYLLYHDGKIVRKKAFGESDVDSHRTMQTTDIFRLASMTKPIASLALLLLQEDGLINMNDRLDKYLPAFAEPLVMNRMDTLNGTVVIQTHKAKNPILLRHLLTHSAGFASQYGGELGNLYQASFPNPYANDIKHFVDQVAKLPLNHEPGEGWVYGPSINVAARVIEVVTGMAFQDFLQLRILEPMGMSETKFFLEASDAERLTTYYVSNGDGKLVVKDRGSIASSLISWPKVYYSASGGLTSTLDDYLKFCTMILNNGIHDGKKIAKPETIALMKTDQLPLNINADLNTQPGQLTEGFTFGYQIVRQENNRSLKKKGTLSWSGATGPIFFIDPATKLIGIYMFQLQPNSQIISRKTFADWMIKSINP